MALPELLLDESNAVPDTRFAPALSAPLRLQRVKLLLLQYFNSGICVAGRLWSRPSKRRRRRWWPSSSGLISGWPVELRPGRYRNWVVANAVEGIGASRLVGRTASGIARKVAGAEVERATVEQNGWRVLSTMQGLDRVSAEAGVLG